MYKKINFTAWSVVASIFVFSLSAHAQYRLKDDPSICPIKKYVGGKWVNANASEIGGGSYALKKVGNSTTQSAIVVNGVWYAAANNCFENAAGFSTANEPSKTNEESAQRTQVFSNTQDRSTGLEIMGNLLIPMSEEYDPISLGFGGGLKLGIALGNVVDLTLSGQYLTGSGEVASGVSTGFSFINFGIGPRIYFVNSTFKPFLELNGIFSIVNLDLSLGAVSVTASGLGFGGSGGLGTLISLSDSIDLLVAGKYAYLSSSNLSVGDVEYGQTANLSHIGVDLGIRINF